ncbi:VanW family protein [Candidatus Daviesbacteria bacterium]|nr:VanW family protein [Candidatus Daviesbacteria bacterium]
MAKAKKIAHFQFVKKNLLPVILFIVLFVLTIITVESFLADKYYPQTFVGDTNISFLTEGQAIQKVQLSFQKRSRQKLQFNFSAASKSGQTFTIDLATSSASLDYSSLDSNFRQSHSGTPWDQINSQAYSLFFASRISPKIALSLEKQFNAVASQIDLPPQNAQLIFDETPEPESSSSARIQIKESVDGLALDKEGTEKIIKDFLLTGKYSPLLPAKTIPPQITTSHVTRAKDVLDTVLKEPVKLTFDNKTFVLDAKQLLTLLDFKKGTSLLDQDQGNTYLKKLAQEIDTEVQEGLFEFNPDTKRVNAFKPSREGRKLDVDKTFDLISESLLAGSLKTITLPVDIVKPKIETSNVNSLGIKELLGRGISNFAGSIPNRIYNIGLTATRINGVLVPPGETFSFNKTVGDISAATGFKQAYVIKEGRTVLDDGGGVCQDSTTLFRAVLNAGLPVIKRTAHAYRVSYYEQGFPPGLDATIFYPSVDFQFKNDTSNHILIQAYTSGTTLYVDLYGTPDGRTSILSKSQVTNLIPAPTELRQDDPALPKGTVKQVDWAAQGATVTFTRTVVRGNETLISETWKSVYRPWQAVFLVGTKEN